MKTQLIGDQDGCEKQGVYLGRTISWEEDGIHWRPNPKHIQRVIRDLGLESGNSVPTPLLAENIAMTNEVPMDPDEASRYRSMAARINYAAQDRPDLSLASTIAASKMSNPCIGDMAILKRIARYCIGRCDSSLIFPWQDDEPDTLVLSQKSWPK